MHVFIYHGGFFICSTFILYYMLNKYSGVPIPFAATVCDGNGCKRELHRNVKSFNKVNFIF